MNNENNNFNPTGNQNGHKA